MLSRLVGSGWDAGAKTLRIATLSLVYLTAEYCAPVWCRSVHARLIDSVLNDALHIVTGCLRPIPTDHQLSGIQPVEFCRLGATLSLAYVGSLDQERLRRPFVPDARLCQLREIFWTTLPDLASALLNGRIVNGMRSIVKILPGSVFLCPGPVQGLLRWAFFPSSFG